MSIVVFLFSSNKSDAVNFPSSSFGDKAGASGTSDFWAAELSWQREELAKTFAVQVITPFAVS